MAKQIDLGAVVPIGKGDWNIGTTYERANIVRHNSVAWICKVESSTGVEPTEDSSDWYLLVKDTSSVTSVNGQRGDVNLDIITDEEIDNKISELESKVNNRIPGIMQGATDEIDGKEGLVPKPDAGKQDYILKGNGSWYNIQSDLSTMNTKIQTAQNTANNANTAASNAQSTANSASTAASNAQNTANSALSTAQTAQNNANTANNNASNALSLRASNAQYTHSVNGLTGYFSAVSPNYGNTWFCWGTVGGRNYYGNDSKASTLGVYVGPNTTIITATFKSDTTNSAWNWTAQNVCCVRIA